MKEVVFVRRNVEKWRKANELIGKISQTSPEEIADTYLEISADLAFARTHYPDSNVVSLLNNLTLRLHNTIYGSRPQRLRRITTFWTQEIPAEIYRQRRYVLASLLLFVGAVVLGAISYFADNSFAETVLGRGYIETTLDNIERGKPMGIYGTDKQYNMMFYITFNNIFVSLLTYVMGLFTYFFPGLIIVRNGIMLGAFMAFFSNHGLLSECLMALWMHGVLEITAMIIAGGAGLVLGCGWLFPGSLPRGTSFRLNARSSVKIIIGILPVWICAAFIESYITRHTNSPIGFRLGIIITSLMFVVFYFIYLPYRQRNANH